MEGFLTLGAIVGVIVLWGVIKYLTFKERKRFLTSKYHDEKVVAALMNREVWFGMTEGQLVDSRGYPEDKSVKLLKKKNVETFKYNKTGKNRYDFKVTVENGTVVGWEKK